MVTNVLNQKQTGFTQMINFQKKTFNLWAT